MALQEQVKLDSLQLVKPPSSDVAGQPTAPPAASKRKRAALGHKGIPDAAGRGAKSTRCTPFTRRGVQCGGRIEPGRARSATRWTWRRRCGRVQDHQLYRGVCGHCRKTHEPAAGQGGAARADRAEGAGLIGALGTRVPCRRTRSARCWARCWGALQPGAISQAQGWWRRRYGHRCSRRRRAATARRCCTWTRRAGAKAGPAPGTGCGRPVQPQVVVYRCCPRGRATWAQALAGERQPACW